MGGRQRLDELVVHRGLAATRAEAARLILAGRVRVGARRADKAGQAVSPAALVELATPAAFVGRGGEKLAAALEAFAVSPRDRVCLDVGASTGGFTDCLLQRGARRLYALDVGRGQLHERLRSDPRVTILDEVNARYLEPERLGEPPSLIVVDVAFISVTKVLPALSRCLAADGDFVVLVKPQFEVGRGRVGKGGVVRDATLHREVLGQVARAARSLGLSTRGVVASPLRGPKGNREFFLHLVQGTDDPARGDLAAAIAGAVGDRA